MMLDFLPVGVVFVVLAFSGLVGASCINIIREQKKERRTLGKTKLVQLTHAKPPVVVSKVVRPKVKPALRTISDYQPYSWMEETNEKVIDVDSEYWLTGLA